MEFFLNDFLLFDDMRYVVDVISFNTWKFVRNIVWSS